VRRSQEPVRHTGSQRGHYAQRALNPSPGGARYAVPGRSKVNSIEANDMIELIAYGLPIVDTI